MTVGMPGVKVLPAYEKSYQRGARIPGWACYSPPGLIEQSCEDLVVLADLKGWDTIVLPMPGVGQGGMSVSESEALCRKYFDDRFTVVMR